MQTTFDYVVWGGAVIAAALALVLVAMVLIWKVSPGSYAITDNPNARYIQFDNGTIRYEDTGQGRPVIVFLHGFNAELNPFWDKIWARTTCGRRVRLDVPGFGASRWSTSDYSLPAQSRRLDRFVEQLQLVDITLVGASMGGSLAAWYGATRPEKVKELILLAPSGYPGSLTYSGLFGMMVKPGIMNRLATLLADSAPYRLLFPDSRAMQALSVTASYGRPWLEAIRGIDVPTTILWSEGDSTVPVHYAEKVAAAIDKSRLMVLDESVGHGIAQQCPGCVVDLLCPGGGG